MGYFIFNGYLHAAAACFPYPLPRRKMKKSGVQGLIVDYSSGLSEHKGERGRPDAANASMIGAGS